MAKQNTKSKKGFTIIEVVLVLAIAGLIFLMVFIALPALQRSQRDTQRRDDMARFISQLSQYQANNGGNVPTSKSAFTQFIYNYLQVRTTSGTASTAQDSFKDPSGANYQIGEYYTCKNGDCPQKSTAEDYKTGKIAVYVNAKCNGENPQYIQGTRKIAITYKLEGAGIYCGNN